jgi:steroid delta-isomerase-like uncharacterized protein
VKRQTAAESPNSTGETTMSVEQHKALVQQFVDEFWNAGNLAAADEFMDSRAVVHEPVAGAPADLKLVAQAIHAAFPDWHSTVEEMIAEGDRVVERWTGRGTHRGEFQGIPPTGKRVTVPGVVLYRIANGKIIEFRGQFDRMSLFEQLGGVPNSGDPTP